LRDARRSLGGENAKEKNVRRRDLIKTLGFGAAAATAPAAS